MSNSRDSVTTLTHYSTSQHRQTTNTTRNDSLITRENIVYNELDVGSRCTAREICNRNNRKYSGNENDEATRNFHDDQLLDGGELSRYLSIIVF